LWAYNLVKLFCANVCFPLRFVLVSWKCQFNLYRHITQKQYPVVAVPTKSCRELHDWSYLGVICCMSDLCSVFFLLDLVPYVLHILHTASTQATWLPALFSNSCFDVLDLTESVDMLDSPGLVVTVPAASDWDLVNSVTELSCLTHYKLVKCKIGIESYWIELNLVTNNNKNNNIIKCY
jgi:hypothetical protein